MRLAARMKLLFIAAINHVYYCNSWSPTWSHNPTEVCCDWRYGYREDTFAKGHLYFMTEFTASARETDVCVCSELLWWQELPGFPSSLSPSILWPTGWDPSAQPCCLSVLLARRLCLCHRGFVPFLGDEGSQFGEQNPNQQLDHLQAAVLAVQMGLLKILWPIKDTCICLLLFCLLGLWFLSALVHLTYPMGKN